MGGLGGLRRDLWGGVLKYIKVLGLKWISGWTLLTPGGPCEAGQARTCATPVYISFPIAFSIDSRVIPVTRKLKSPRVSTPPVMRPNLTFKQFWDLWSGVWGCRAEIGHRRPGERLDQTPHYQCRGYISFLSSNPLKVRPMGQNIYPLRSADIVPPSLRVLGSGFRM